MNIRETNDPGYPYHFYEFFSWGDFVERASNPEYRKHVPLNSQQSQQDSYDFSACRTFDEAKNLALNGWPEGEGKALRIARDLFDKVSSVIEKPTVVYDVTGMAIDMAAYIQGEPECWMRQDTEFTEGVGKQHLKVVFNIGASGGISKEAIHAKGATVAALIQLLEYSGRRVELWVMDIANCPRKNFGMEYRILVKKADQDLDMGRVIFALAHPACLRRLGFAVMESCPELYKLDNGAFGSDVYYGAPEDSKDRGDIYINCSMYGDIQWEDPCSAEEWALDELKKQGVHLVEEGETK